MLRNIFVVSLFVYAVCAAHREISEVRSAENPDEEISPDDLLKKQFSASSIQCTICKYIVMAVKMALSAKPTVDEIKTKLKKACDIFQTRKEACKNLVEKFMNKLVNELESHDAPNIVCTKIFICQVKTIKEFDFGFDEALKLF